MPRTPAVARPIERTSDSANRMLIPCAVAMMMSFVPSVIFTVTGNVSLTVPVWTLTVRPALTAAFGAKSQK